jgi:hypothetical protein
MSCVNRKIEANILMGGTMMVDGQQIPEDGRCFTPPELCLSVNEQSMEARGDEQIELGVLTQTFFAHRPEFMEPCTITVFAILERLAFIEAIHSPVSRSQTAQVRPANTADTNFDERLHQKEQCPITPEHPRLPLTSRPQTTIIPNPCFQTFRCHTTFFVVLVTNGCTSSGYSEVFLIFTSVECVSPVAHRRVHVHPER